ncbi:MAG: adenylosuccinate lyase [Candidatus Hatepunaea meridiana]|nr:adenylosuccinate lyase [Candidatus Hatepunaea meridiana]
MIPRYTPKIMEDLWGECSKWERVLKVELAVIDIYAEDGIIPVEVAAEIHSRAAFDTDKINDYETVVKHDVIAFLQSVGDSLDDLKRWLHLGLTSYDVIDTALSIALTQAGAHILVRLENLREALGKQALLHKDTLMPGRTHGVHAEPYTLGWKICGWIAEADRDIDRLKRAIETVRVGKLSGAVGTYPSITPDQEERILDMLDLLPDTISTQVIARDRHAEFVTTLTMIGGLVERIALEIRLLQHSEVEEIYEPFSKGQRGSSAMPHKKNPVSVENMCGLVRLLRSYTIAAFENLPLWHERDISHSSVERIILPDATSLTYYMLERITWVIENWIVDKDRMRENINNDRGLMMSGALLTALKYAGIEDQDIYHRVQQHALAVRTGGQSLAERIRDDKKIIAAVGDKLDEIFDEEAVLKRTDIPFKRVGL